MDREQRPQKSRIPTSREAMESRFPSPLTGATRCPPTRLQGNP